MPIRRAYLDLPHGQLHYRSLDGPAPTDAPTDIDATPLVLLHRTARSSLMYGPLMHALAGDRPLFAFDTPGFGQSDPPPPAPLRGAVPEISTPPPITWYADALLDATQRLGLNRFHLLGHHTGSIIATQIALADPDRVASLTLSGPPFLDAPTRAYWRSRIEPPLVLRPDGAHLLKTWDYVHAFDPHASLDIIEQETLDTLRADRWQETLNAVFDYDLPAQLPRVRVPLLLICGRGDELYPYFAPACAARPDARHVHLDAGIYALEQHPALFPSHLRTFFSTVDAPNRSS